MLFLITKTRVLRMGVVASDLQKAQALVGDVVRQHLPPPPQMLCSDWADGYRQIAVGPERGRWKTSRTPYLREPMNCTDPEAPYEQVVMQFATQLGKTEVLYNALFKRIHLSPQNMMFVQPTLQDAKDHSRTRFMPAVKRMPELLEVVPTGRSRDETNTWQTKEINGGVATMFFAGANSARSLASKPLGFIACDEIDGYPADVDGEGDPLKLLWERMSNFGNSRKFLLCSTPTIKDFSRIEAAYLKSDQRKYWLPCPHCGEHQVLELLPEKEYGLKWLKNEAGKDLPDTAVYICQHCGCAIDEHHKTDMLAAGEWRRDNPDEKKVAGFWLNKLYSPLGWKSWSMVVEEYLDAKAAQANGDESSIKTFTNTTLAKTWEGGASAANEHELFRRAGDWPLRVALPGMYVTTMGVDTQGDRLEAYIWGWGRNMERQLIDRLVIQGDPALAEGTPGSPWTELTAYRHRPVTYAHTGKTLPLLATFIDSHGHHTHHVYTYARMHQYEKVMAVGGLSQRSKPILGRASWQDINLRGTRLKKGVKLWGIGTDTAKHEIYGRLRKTEAGAGYVHLSKQMPMEVFEQLTAERLHVRYSKGRAIEEWVKPNGKRNEALDCAVYALAAAIWAGVEKWNESEWKRWQAAVEEVDLFDLAAMQKDRQQTTPGGGVDEQTKAKQQSERRPTARPWAEKANAPTSDIHRPPTPAAGRFGGSRFGSGGRGGRTSPFGARRN